MSTITTTKATVLAVDDASEILDLLAFHLRAEHVTLLTAKTFDEGLAIAKKELPDLILLDVELPEHSGFDLCRRLKEDELTRDIPVIFLTGSSDIATKVHGFDLGAVDYVTKPFAVAELRARVRAALRMKRAQDMLKVKVQLDVLTGLRNRAFFDERLNAEVAAAFRHHRPLSLVMVDLDHFKSLNDRFGHPFGDSVLQRVGDSLVRALRPMDAACRYGGEELALILPDTDLSAAVSVAERVRDLIREIPFEARGKRVAVTASLGVAELHGLLGKVSGVLTPSRLLVAADRALYEAKSAGRDCVRTADAAPRIVAA
jgi:diguanylate cyclase (GGDEF)-like protein